MKNSPNKKREIIKKYDSTSHFYDERYIEIQNEKYEYILKEFSFADKIVLDAGCGTGLFYDFLLTHLIDNSNNRYFFIGVDISWNMLKGFFLKLQTREKLVKNQVSLVLSDLENLPFRENTFQALVSLTSLQNLPSIITGINESFRVTRDNSKVKFSILKKTINLGEVLSHIKSRAIKLEIIDNDDLEDVILKFNLQKKK